jgi:hypothetical protein
LVVSGRQAAAIGQWSAANGRQSSCGGRTLHEDAKGQAAILRTCPVQSAPSQGQGEALLLDSSQSSLEPIQPSAGVHKLLLAGVKRMALGANVHTHLTALGGTGHYRLPTGAANGTLNIFGMDSILHFSIPHSEIPHVFRHRVQKPYYYITSLGKLQGFF